MGISPVVPTRCLITHDVGTADESEAQRAARAIIIDNMNNSSTTTTTTNDNDTYVCSYNSTTTITNDNSLPRGFGTPSKPGGDVLSQDR